MTYSVSLQEEVKQLRELHREEKKLLTARCGSPMRSALARFSMRSHMLFRVDAFDILP